MDAKKDLSVAVTLLHIRDMKHFLQLLHILHFTTINSIIIMIFVSSDRSSYSDSGLLEVRKAAATF